MDVQIQKLDSTVRAVDSESLFAPSMITGIVAQAMEDNHRRKEREDAEKKLTKGVKDELEA